MKRLTNYPSIFIYINLKPREYHVVLTRDYLYKSAMITFIFILPVMRKQLTLSRLRSAGQVVYNRKSIQLANKVKKLFTLKSKIGKQFQSISPKLRFQLFLYFGTRIFECYHLIPLSTS